MEGSTVQDLLKRLKELRLERGLTQEQFAEASGISYKYYQAVEAGRKKDLRLSTLLRFAQAHGIALWQLFYPERPKSDLAKKAGNKKKTPKSR